MSDSPIGNAPPAVTHVLLIGHCGFDGASIRRVAEKALPDAKIVVVGSSRDLETYGNPSALWLVNRQLGGGFGTPSGVELIRQHAGQDEPPLMMLVSNFEDAQAEAEAAGALPGFGKSALGSPATLEAIRRAAAGQVELDSPQP